MAEAGERFHPSEYIQDELDARGWSLDELAIRMGGDFGVNRARIERLREEQRLAEESRRATLSDAERMERAFAASYRKPPGCAEAGTLECANHYIRAKRSFEAQYAREQARQRAASAP